MSTDSGSNESVANVTRIGGQSSMEMQNLIVETYEKVKVHSGFPEQYLTSTLHNVDDMHRSYDDDLATIMTGILDTLIVFGGLFAAIVMTSLIEIREIRKGIDGDSLQIPLSYARLPWGWTERLWWLSLILALCSSLGAVIAKDYISRYSKDSLSGKPTRNALLHIVRFAGITRWYLRTVIDLLPIILHVGMCLFLVGLAIVVQRDRGHSLVLTLLCGAGFLYGSRLIIIYARSAIFGVELQTSSDGIISFIIVDVQDSLFQLNRFIGLAVASALPHALSTSILKNDIHSLRIRTVETVTLFLENVAAFLSWRLSESIRNPTEIGSHQEPDLDAITDHTSSYFYAIYRLILEWSPPALIRGPWIFQMKPVSLKLPWKIITFTQKSVVPSFGITNQGVIPNLTGHINIVTGPLFPGGFSDIYSGEFKSEWGTEKVAMKMLRIFSNEAHMVKAKKKFRKEVDMWCSLKHPHVLPFYGTCELDEFRIFMVSPWAQGGSSSEYLRRNPFADRNKILLQTASALEYLHSGMHAPPIVHGDLKADNVLISITGDALLADFGLSIHVEEILSLSGSSSGRAGGNPRFMAPELLLPPNNTSDISRPTRESDVFSFACLMLQLFTGQVPFAYLRREVQAIMEIANGKLPLRPTDPVVLERGCSDNVWCLMTECWRFNPLERPNMMEIRMRMVAQRRGVL